MQVHAVHLTSEGHEVDRALAAPWHTTHDHRGTNIGRGVGRKGERPKIKHGEPGVGLYSVATFLTVGFVRLVIVSHAQGNRSAWGET